MSYCRWSSDHWQCDVYVYEDVNGGWTTHVASRRLKHKPPEWLLNMPNKTPKDWWKVYKADQEWHESIPSEEISCNVLKANGKTEPGTYKYPKDSEYIDLKEISPFAEETFNDPTPEACARRLEEIRASGLNVPQRAIDSLLKEQKEFDANNQ